LLNFGFFAGGIYLAYNEIKELIEEDWQSITISILSFLSIFLIYLGMAIQSNIQNFGAYLLVIDILFLVFCKD
jgi:amino acid transporter